MFRQHFVSRAEQVDNDLVLICSYSYITHYSYFGAFRSSAANDFVGPNVAMLDRGGGLTDIGAWYLGRHATGNLPSDSTPRNGAVRPEAISNLLMLLTFGLVLLGLR